MVHFTQVLVFRKIFHLVGDIHITGIVNIAGLMDHLTLQTTRLSTVIALADVIACGILKILPAEADLSPVDLDYANSIILAKSAL